MVRGRVAGGGVEDSRSIQPRIRKVRLLITHVLDSCVKLLAVLYISSAQGQSVDCTFRGSSWRGLPSTAWRGPQIIPSQSALQQNPHESASHQNTQFSYRPSLCVAHGCHTHADRTSSGPDDLESVRARRSVPTTRQYVTSLLLSSRVPCLRCLFHANTFSKDL